MAKTKSFAEKMQKSSLSKGELAAYKVIRPKISNKGTVRFETKVIKIKAGENENKALGI